MKELAVYDNPFGLELAQELAARVEHATECVMKVAAPRNLF
jgi:hypothetical protein